MITENFRIIACFPVNKASIATIEEAFGENVNVNKISHVKNEALVLLFTFGL